jgi:hypothetical protein
MKPIGSTRPRPVVSAQPLPLALAGGALILGLVAAVRLAVQPEADAVVRPAPVYDATSAMLAAIGPSSAEALAVGRPAPVYDATGAMQAAIDVELALPPSSIPFVYDATGTMLEALP